MAYLKKIANKDDYDKTTEGVISLPVEGPGVKFQTTGRPLSILQWSNILMFLAKELLTISSEDGEDVSATVNQIISQIGVNNDK